MAGDYSIHTGYKRTFTWPDYLMFALMLLVSTGIGLFYAIKDRKKSNTSEYLFAGRNMYTFPVALSFAVTFLSALTLLGVPAEIYNYHTMYWWIVLGTTLATAGAAHVFLPFFYGLQITSIYEYLEMRFGKAVRLLGSGSWIFETLLYMAFVIYGPSLALNVVTGFSLEGSMVAMGLVVTVYTALGGIKAVIWTDTFQAVIILVGLVAVIIQGSLIMEGFGNAWRTAEERSRIYLHDFNADPRGRVSFWAVVIGGGFAWMSVYAVNQSQVQRALTCATVRKMKIAIWINACVLAVIITLCTMVGILLYAFYSDCHPLKFNLITDSDQLFPLFVMDILGHMKGLPGIFISCIFSGSLSTLSSALSALPTVILEDFIRPYCCSSLTEFKTTLISKVIVLLFGIIALSMAFLAANLSNIMQSTYTVYSVVDGPLFGLFVLGIFFPWANKWGALCGYIISLAIMMWIGVCKYLYGKGTPYSEHFIHGCNWNITGIQNLTNMTQVTTPFSGLNSSTLTFTEDSGSGHLEIYEISFLYFTPLGMFLTVIAGLIVSFATGYTRPTAIDSKLICPLFDVMFPCLPEKIRKPLRFGIVHEKAIPTSTVSGTKDHDTYNMQNRLGNSNQHDADTDQTKNERERMVKPRHATQTEGQEEVIEHLLTDAL